MEFKLIRMKDDFVIWSPDSNKNGANPPVAHKYRIDLSDLRLTVKKTKTVDKIFNHYYNGVSGRIPEIPFTRNMIRSYTALDKVTDLSFPNFVEQRQLPEVLCIHLQQPYVILKFLRLSMLSLLILRLMMEMQVRIRSILSKSYSWRLVLLLMEGKYLMELQFFQEDRMG